MASKKQQTLESLDARAVAAVERARMKLAANQTEQTFDYLHAPLSWWRQRWSDQSIRRLFIESFIFIRDAFDENKLVLFKFNDLQADLHEKLTGRDVVLKFRRGGVSRYLLAAKLADAVVMGARNVRIVPHDPDTEAELRADLKQMYEHLPPHLKPRAKAYSEELIWLHDELKGTHHARITTASVQPGHEEKGRGQTITDLQLTEVPFWRGDAKKAATALVEAAAGGRVTVEATPNGIEWMHSIYQQGKLGKGGWKSHFYQWYWMRHYQIEGAVTRRIGGEWVLVSPGDLLIGEIEPAKVQDLKVTTREKWVAWKVRNHLRRMGLLPDDTVHWWSAFVAPYIAWRRAKIAELPRGEDQFLVEYPEDDVRCFEATGRPLVQHSYLKPTCAFTEPIDGREYAIGVDTSLGLAGGDSAAIQIIDLWTGRQAFEQELKLPPDLLAYRVGELSDKYNWAEIVVERNGPGIATINKLLELGYGERLYRYLDARLRRAIEDGRLSFEEAQEQAQYGFPTNSETKPLLGLKLEEGIRTTALGISSEALCAQLRTCVWFDNKSWGALSGYHDDLVVALAIVWLAKKTEAGIARGFVGVLPECGDLLDGVTTSSFRN